jgi:UDP-glucose 4-epimerase
MASNDLYLVTGGRGFIGSHIVEELERQGKRVRVVDILDGDDIRYNEAMDGVMEGVGYVIHQAAIPGVQQSLRTPLATNSTNVEGTLCLLESARKHKVKRFVYASSSSVYGQTNMNPKTESMTPAPLSPYAVSKYAGELYCQSYLATCGLPIVILRYFNVFGPRHQSGTAYTAAVPCFLSAALLGEHVTVDGCGDQTRDFTYVKNVVDANILACHNEKAIGEVFNIGCGKSTPISTLVGLVNEVTGSRLGMRFRNRRVGDVRHSMASIKKAQKILGYNPEIGLLEGLRLTWEWMQNQ